MVTVKNIYAGFPRRVKRESIIDILSADGIRIEGIKTHPGGATPEGEWHDREHNEFVMVLRGEAELLFEEDGKRLEVKMVGGDYIEIPAHTRHRIERVASNTYWLALFYKK